MSLSKTKKRVHASKKMAPQKSAPALAVVPQAAPPTSQAVEPIAAGSGKAQIQIVWEWVRDHPNATSRATTEETGLQHSIVSGLFTILTNRKMVRRIPVPASGVGSNGGIAFTYVVNPKMKAYKLLPLPEKEKAAPAPDAAAPAADAPPKPIVTKDLLEKMNVRDAKKLYQELHAFFGPAAPQSQA